MIVTIDFMKKAFEQFNKEFFKNILPTPTFELNKDSTNMGTCARLNRLHADGSSYYKYVINISTYFDCPQIEHENTMIHEMCHLWVFITHPNTTESSHGPIWQSIANKVTNASKYKYVISAKSLCPELATNDDVARNGYKSTDVINFFAYKCMDFQHKDKWFCFAVNPKSIETFDGYVERLRKQFKLSSAISGKIIRGCLSKKPRNFPLCREIAKGHFLTENEFSKQVLPNITDVRYKY